MIVRPVALQPGPGALEERLAADLLARVVPSASSCFSTTFWVEIPAWS